MLQPKHGHTMSLFLRHGLTGEEVLSSIPIDEALTGWDIMRKFRLTTTSRVRASTYAWGPCSTGDADKACKNTQANQTQIP